MPYFKYCPPERSNVLTTLLLRYSPPSTFNDPFDCIPAIENFDVGVSSFEQYEGWQWERYQQFIVENPAVSETFNHHKKRLLPYEDWARLVKLNAGSYFGLFDKKYREMLGNLGILCLCENGHSPAMWAHYGKEHTGFLLEFDSSHRFFTDQQKGSHLKVEYVRDRPKWDYAANKGPADLFRFKSEEWLYEREVRYVALFSARPDMVADDKGVRCMVKIPAELLLSVTVGYRCDAKVVANLKASLDRPHFKHVNRFYSSPDRDHFRINREAGWPLWKS